MGQLTLNQDVIICAVQCYLLIVLAVTKELIIRIFSVVYIRYTRVFIHSLRVSISHCANMLSNVCCKYCFDKLAYLYRDHIKTVSFQL